MRERPRANLVLARRDVTSGLFQERLELFLNALR